MKASATTAAATTPAAAAGALPGSEPWLRRHWKWAAALAGAAALALLAGLLLRSGNPAQTFRLRPVAAGPVVATVTASGTVNPTITVLVGSQVSGQILELFADFNAEVKTGQLIARIDPALFATQVQQAAADVAVARAAVAVQRATLPRAQADIAVAEATLAGLHQQTHRARSAAEDAGRISSRKRRLFETGAGTQADRETAQASYDEALASVLAAEAQEAAQAATIRSLQAALAVAQATLVQAEAQVAQKQAVLDNAQVNLAHTEIRAPVDGTVIQRAVDVGQTVAASLQAPLLFSIARDLRSMQVDASVDEADVGAIREGQQVEFSVDAHPGRVFRGQVVQVRKNPQVVQNVVTYDAVLSAPNADLALLPGLTANIRIITARRETALLVPNAALRWRPPGAAAAPAAFGSGTVYVLGSEGRPQAVALQLGISDGNVTEVTSGALQAGQQVVVGEATRPAASRPLIPGGPRL